MTAKRPYLEALGIPLWLPRQTLAVHPQPSNAPLPPAGEALVGERAEESNHPGAARHPSLAKEGKLLMLTLDKT